MVVLTKEQFEARRACIGGSDAAAILGMSRWRSPMDVYLEKIGATDMGEPSEAAYWGGAIEPILRSRFAHDHYEYEVVITESIEFHPEHQWMGASYDGLCYPASGMNPIAGWEGKTASAWKKAEWDGESVPDEYWIQCQHYMAVSGLNDWWLSVLIGGQDYREWRIQRDDEAIAALIAKEAAFWDLVETRTPPDIDGSEACSLVLSALYPAEQVIQESVRLDDAATSIAENLMTLKAEAKERETLIAAAENTLKGMLGEHESGYAGNYHLRWSPRTRSGNIDAKRLKEELPTIARAFSKPETHYRVFTISEEGE